MTSIDSWRAASMKAQVLTMTTSAASGDSASTYPASPIIDVTLSESTWFLEHPSVSSHTVGGVEVTDEECIRTTKPPGWRAPSRAT